jgi:hypothetical protein
MRLSHLVFSLSLLTARAAASQQARPSGASIPRATSQVVAGTAAIPAGVLFGVAVGYSALEKDGNPIPMMLGGATGATFGPALAVRMVGTGGAPHGSTADAVAGTLVGWAATLVATPLVSKIPLVRSHPDGLLPLAYLAAFALPAVGATLAYDRSHR